MSGTSSVEKHKDSGKAIRKRLPRKQLGSFDIGKRDVASHFLAAHQNQDPDLVALSAAAMATSPYVFFQGSAKQMANDLAQQTDTGLICQLIGNADPRNFGGYGLPGREIVFDAVDFGETHEGPFEWDVKRLVTGALLMGMDRGASDRQARKLASIAANSYLDAIRGFDRESMLTVWYSQLDDDDSVAVWAESGGARTVAEIMRSVKRARRRTNQHAVQEMTKKSGSKRRFRRKLPLLEPISDLLSEADAAGLRQAVDRGWQAHLTSLGRNRQYLLSRYQLVDLARLVVGVPGSSVRRYAALLVEEGDVNEPVVLELGEVGSSGLQHHVPTVSYDGDAQRLITGQRLIQATPDPFLSWLDFADHDGTERTWQIRQLRDWKRSLDLANTGERGQTVFMKMCGWALARAHARSGDRHAIAGYVGRNSTTANALVAFADAYAAQIADDHRTFCAAIAKGQIAVPHADNE